MADNVPFSRLNDNEFSISVKNGILNPNNCRVDFVPTEFQQKIFDSVNSAISNNAFDLDNETESGEDPIPIIDCRYYSINEFTSSNFSPSKNFSVLHYNIHSMQLHIEEFRIALLHLNFTFDIICISESKLMKDVDPLIDISINGYKPPISTPSEATKGGVLIYVKSELNFKPRDDLKIYKSEKLESIFIEVINEKESNDIVGVIYRHPSMIASEFTDVYLKTITDKISNENKKVFIAGDFNFDLLNSYTHNDTYEFFDTMMSNFLLPVITIPTKINRGTNSLIDNIFTNHLNPDTISGNLVLNLSDGHLPSFMITPKKNQNHLPKKHNIYRRSAKFDKEALINDFQNINWNEVIDTSKNDVNFSLENFLTKINGLLDTHVPLKKLSHKEFKQKFKPWISTYILSKIDDKNKSFKKYIHSKNSTHKVVLYSKFKVLKNEVTLLIRSSKKEYYKQYFAKNKDNIKKKSGKVLKKLLISSQKIMITQHVCKMEMSTLQILLQYQIPLIIILLQLLIKFWRKENMKDLNHLETS